MKNFKTILKEQNIKSVRKVDPSLSPYLVSTRLPGDDSTNAPTGTEKLTVGMENYGEKEVPKLANLLTSPQRIVKGEKVQVYPNIGPDILKLTDPKEVLNATQKHMERNLGWGIERAYALPELAERSQQWYVGAHNISKKFGERFGVPHHVAAAVIATQSPQKDWYQNVSLGERILKIHKEHQNTGWSPEMATISSKVFKPEEKHQNILKEIQGKSLGELRNPLHKAAWIRTYDEAHHPRHHRLVTPEGEFAEHATTVSGAKSPVAWGDFGSIAKAVRAIESGGDMKTISGSLGGEHKVRSFYNNIIQPNTPKIISPMGEDPRDVTGDTHATGNIYARPSLVSKSIEVGDILGGAPSSKETGMAGTYPLAASAFRTAADIHGLVPNAVQSVVWDERRATNANKKQKEAVDNVWKSHQSGEISHENALRMISDILGPTKKPSWAHTRGNPLLTSTFESKNNIKFNILLEKIKENKLLKRLAMKSYSSPMASTKRTDPKTEIATSDIDLALRGRIESQARQKWESDYAKSAAKSKETEQIANFMTGPEDENMHRYDSIMQLSTKKKKAAASDIKKYGYPSRKTNFAQQTMGAIASTFARRVGKTLPPSGSGHY